VTGVRLTAPGVPRRMAFLREALKRDLEPPAPPAGAAARGPVRSKDVGDEPNRVRPGRLLTVLAAMQRGLAAQGAPAGDERLARLDAMRAATLQLLDEVQAERVGSLSA
jgi:hypothetical protein